MRKLGAAISFAPGARQLPPQGLCLIGEGSTLYPRVGWPDASRATKNWATKNWREFCLIIETYNQQDSIAWRLCSSHDVFPLTRDLRQVPSLFGVSLFIKQGRGTPSGLSRCLHSGILCFSLAVASSCLSLLSPVCPNWMTTVIATINKLAFVDFCFTCI